MMRRFLILVCVVGNYIACGSELIIRGADRPRVGVGLIAELEGCDFIWTRGNTKGVYEKTPLATEPEYVLTFDDYEHWIRVTAYQDGIPVANEKIWFSKLPVVYMTTDDGAGITSKEEYKSARLRIQGNDQFQEQYNGKMEIKGRGNTSWATYTQKPYKLKLDSKTNLFGFGKNKHWVLISNYGDNAMMRNKFGSDLAKALDIVGMDMTWVVGILNGAYNGVYMFSEQIRVDSNRVDIFDWESKAEDVADGLWKSVGESVGWTEADRKNLEDQLVENLSWITSGTVDYKEKTYVLSDYGLLEEWDLFGGYLFQLDGRYDEISKFTTDKGLYVSIEKPEFAKTDPSMMIAIQEIWKKVETAYRSEDGYWRDEIEQHYTELCDLRSMAGYWLVMETLSNLDAPVFSRYAYIERGGKMTYGPVWDFDYGGNSITVQAATYASRREATSWAVSKFDHSNQTYMNQSFFPFWTEKPEFCLAAYELYWSKVRPWLAALLSENGDLKKIRTYLSEAGDAHDTKFKRWGFNGTTGDVARYEEWLTERLSWLDQQFANVETLMNSLKFTKQNFPYDKADDILVLSQDGRLKSDMVCSTDYAFEGETDAGFDIEIGDPSIVTVDFYLNGMKKSSAVVLNGKCAFKVAAKELTALVSERAIVLMIARGADGHTVARNYATIVLPRINPEIEKDNAFIPSGTGESWDVDGNWTRGYYPNAVGEKAIIGAPTDVKKNKGWRNIHIENHSVTVGVIEVTNGGWTNRLDNDVCGDLVFNGGGVVVTDFDNSGLLMIDLDDQVVFDSDVTMAVSNLTGDIEYGGLLIKGTIVGNGHDMKKTGPGKMTLAAVVADGAKSLGKLQIAEGIVAITSPIHVESITKEGAVYLLMGGADLESATNKAVVCDDKISVNHVALFVPTVCGGVVSYGGAVAKSVIGKSTSVSVYVRDPHGGIRFQSECWSLCAAAEVESFACGDGLSTYKVKVPVIVPDGVIAPAHGVDVVAIHASNPDDAIAKVGLLPPDDSDGRPVCSKEVYASYFRFSAQPLGDTEYAVQAHLNEAVMSLDLTTSMENVAGACVGSGEAEIVTRPGLYYSLLTTPSLAEVFSEGARFLATDTVLNISIPNLGECGFYKIKISVSANAQNVEE